MLKELKLSQELTPKRKQKLKQQTKSQNNTNLALQTDDSESIFREMPPVLLPYQQAFLAEIEKGTHTTYLYEKSRRIGITWCVAALAVLEAAKKNGGDVIYISTSLDLAKEFLLSVAFWARNFKIVCDSIQDILYESDKDSILSLRISFSSGFRVIALPSKPESVRGRKARFLIMDEVAHLDNLSDFINAVSPLAIWGTKFIYISTHNGINNKFNQLCESVRKGELPYSLSKCTFREAINQGLYHRICLAQKQPWSKEKEKLWIKQTYDECPDATQELDVIPSENSTNSIFKKADFKIIDDDELPEYFDYELIAFDTAATEKQHSCYTACIVLAKLECNYYILDFQYIKANAINTQEFIQYNITKHGSKTPAFIELEGGSQSLLYFENCLKASLPNNKIYGVKPEGSKLIRAVPVAEKVKEGKVFLPRRHWLDDFLNNIAMFDGTPGVPLVTDLGDALSLAFLQINKGMKALLPSATVIPQTKNRFTTPNRLR